MLQELLLTLIGSSLKLVDVISSQDLWGCTKLRAALISSVLEVQKMSALDAWLELDWTNLRLHLGWHRGASRPLRRRPLLRQSLAREQPLLAPRSTCLGHLRSWQLLQSMTPRHPVRTRPWLTTIDEVEPLYIVLLWPSTTLVWLLESLLHWCLVRLLIIGKLRTEVRIEARCLLLEPSIRPHLDFRTIRFCLREHWVGTVWWDWLWSASCHMPGISRLMFTLEALS